LLEFFFRFFSFSLLWIGYLCVLSMHSSKGRLRTGASEDRWMVASGCDEWLTTWTDSWLSIAGVGCVLICVGPGEEWARKVYALRSLRGVERQVGLTRGTRWTAGSSAGRMVARKARQSRRSEPVQGSGSQLESARGVCGGSLENR
jgi:hypothetical protein